MPSNTPRTIHLITPELVQPNLLDAVIYPDTTQTHYWSDSWDPEFYVSLARAGFISISYLDPVRGAVLVPELQESYAVLDWEDFHCSRNLRKLLCSRDLAEQEIELRIADSSDRVLEELAAYHGHQSWIHEPYQELIRQLPGGPDVHFAIHGIELWSSSRGELIAGELGYSIGGTYTSLSGFCSRSDRKWRHYGTLQIYMLAELLRERGYAFWNLGHPSLEYKTAIGGRIISRDVFLGRFLEAREARPLAPLAADSIQIRALRAKGLHETPGAASGD